MLLNCLSFTLVIALTTADEYSIKKIIPFNLYIALFTFTFINLIMLIYKYNIVFVN